MSSATASRAKLVLREIVVSLVSLGVLAYCGMYVLGQTDEAALAIDVTQAGPAAAGTVVAYGVVVDKATGKPLRGATITLARGTGGGAYQTLGTATTGLDGTFSIATQSTTSASYRLIAEANVATRTTRSAFVFDAAPGQAYRFDVQLVNKEYFVLLPLPGY